MTRNQPSQRTHVTTLKGCDNLEIMATSVNQDFPLGTTVLQGMVTAHSSSRLANLSSAFQRIRWNNIKFTIEGAYPTTAGGGYVACFVRDPNDVPHKGDLPPVRWAMGQDHSADAKWYDSVVLNVGRSPDLHYTTDIGEARTFSPGTLYVISKGGPAQVGSITVNMHWDVTLSEPTIETVVDEGVVTISEDLTIPFDLSTEIGPIQLSRVTTVGPDPHALTYESVTLQSIGLEPHAAGTYLALKTTKMVSGMYNTGNDYIPVYISGFVVDDNQTLTAVYVLNTTEFYTLQVGSAYVPPAGFNASNWHIVTGGMGAFLEPGDQMIVLKGSGTLVPATTAVFTPRGIQYKSYGGPRVAQLSARQPVGENRATIALSGER